MSTFVATVTIDAGLGFAIAPGLLSDTQAKALGDIETARLLSIGALIESAVNTPATADTAPMANAKAPKADAPKKRS